MLYFVFLAPIIAFFLVRKSSDLETSKLEAWITYTVLIAGAILAVIFIFFKK